MKLTKLKEYMNYYKKIPSSSTKTGLAGTRIAVMTSLALTLLMAGPMTCKSDSGDENLDYLTAALMGGGFTDNFNGTITDNSTSLTWAKCSVGQTYTTLNDCAGTGGGTTWAANSYQFCEAVLDFSITECTNDLGTNPIANDGPAYDACAAFNINGISGWRLPTKEELMAVNALRTYSNWGLLFPQTPDDKYYWTASAEENSADGNQAYGVSFAENDYGQSDLFHKANAQLYVRCVK